MPTQFAFLLTQNWTVFKGCIICVKFSIKVSLMMCRGANVSHNLILKPLRSGVFNITAAMVTYNPVEDAEQQVT